MPPACAFAPYQELLAERFDLLPSCDSIVMMPSLSGPKPCVVRAWTLNLYGTFSLRFWTVRLVSALSPFTWKERKSPAEREHSRGRVRTRQASSTGQRETHKNQLKFKFIYRSPLFDKPKKIQRGDR